MNREMPPVLNVEDASKRLDVPAPTLYRWLADGLLPAERTGANGWIFLRKQVQAIAYVLNAYGRQAVIDGVARQQYNK